MRLRSTTGRLAGSCMALALTVATVLPAEARLGDSRGSPSRSYSAPSRAPSYAPPSNRAYRPSPGRVGGGSSIGVQRPDVTARARAERSAPRAGVGAGAAPGRFGAPAAGAVAGAGVGAAGAQAIPRAGYGAGVPPGGYRGPAPGYGAAPPAGYGAPQAAPQNRGGSWVGPAVAGAAIGAAAGYALGNRNDRNEQAAGTNAAGDRPAASGTADSAAAAPGAGTGSLDAGSTGAGGSGGSGSGGSGGGTGSLDATGAGTGSFGSGSASTGSGASTTFPADAAAPARNSGGMGLMGFGLLAALAALGLMMYRRMSATRAAAARGTFQPAGVPAAGGAVAGGRPGLGSGNPGPNGVGVGALSAAGAAGTTGAADADAQSLMAMAQPLYLQLQELNNRGDLAALRAHTTDDIYPVLAADIQARAEPSRTSVAEVEAKLLDITHEAHRTVASVHYRALVSESPQAAPNTVEEVWHLVKDAAPSATWKLAGIEQV